MVVFPNAKINLGLYITSRRGDGYHNLETCFYPIPWCDVLEIVPSDELSMQVTGLEVPGTSTDNLIVRAYELLNKKYNLPTLSIYLHKIIPMGAGLGGGSADAAFMLKAIDQYFELSISEDDLINYAADLGSDCPFFIKNLPCLATGRGEILTPFNVSLSGYYIGLVFPDFSISTKEAFSGIVPKAPIHDISKVLTQDVREWKNTLFNDFEASLFPQYPKLSEIKNTIYSLGASYASMSGSGSTMFGLFDQNEESKFKNAFSGYTTFWSKL
jgi:4-diphosphocytidyl-2-C-methyl-D-erythritol kinase